MPGINIGDAVLTFFGDTTQLEAAYDTVNSQAKTKLTPAAEAAKGVGDSFKKAGADGQQAGIVVSESWVKVARATAENQSAQKQLADAFALVKQKGGEDVVAMLALAQAQQRAAMSAAELAMAQKEAAGGAEQLNFKMGEAKGTLALVSEEIGVKIPRHLRGFIAEIPGVGVALEAAFSGFAVVMLIQILAEGIGKLMEWREAAEKLREEWTAQDSEFRRTSIGIQDEIDAQQMKFIQLTKGPIAAYEFALKHLRSTAEESLGKISSEIDAAGQKMEARGGIFKSFFGGDDSAGAKKAGKDLLEFSAILQETMHKAADMDKNNPFASYDAGIESVTRKIKELEAQVTEVQNQKDDAGLLESLGLDPVTIQRTVTILQQLQNQLGEMRQREADSQAAKRKEISANILKEEQALGTARINVYQQVGFAMLQVQAEENKQRLERGKESYAKYLEMATAEENKRYEVERSAAAQKLALLQANAANNGAAIIEAQGKIRALELSHQLELSKIHQEGYAHQAQAAIKAMDVIIAASKHGSQERIEDEQQKLEVIKAFYGEESDAYIEQLARIKDAERAHKEEDTKLRDESRRAEDALANDKMAANLRYYQFLQTTARVSAVEVLQMQQAEEEKAYVRKKASLMKQLDELDSSQVLEANKLNDELLLLAQQHNEAKRMNAAQTEQFMEMQYQSLGVKSADAWKREADAAQKAFDVIEKSGKATYVELAQLKKRLLDIKIGAALEAGDIKTAKQLQKELDAVNKTLDKMGVAIKKVNILSNNFFDSWHKQAPKTKDLAVQMSKMMQDAVNDLAAAEASAISAWILGQESLGQALAKATAQVLAQYAARAAIEALYWTAYGFAMLASFQHDRATEAFTAAGMLAAFAGVAGAAAFAISKGVDKGGKNTTDNSGKDSIAGSNSGGTYQDPSAPTQITNVQRFAAGGLITKRTLAIMGDAAHNSNQDAAEAAIPLDNPMAMKKIGEAIAMYSSGGDTYNIKGMISPDNLGKVMNKMSKMNKRGQGKLTASNSMRVTKRSI